jgi:sec-independent protein translocase protein TatC
VIPRRRGPDGAAVDVTSPSDCHLAPPEAGAAAMTLVAHLQELRQRLLVCVGAVFTSAAVSFVFRDAILGFLLRPLPIEANALVAADGTHRIAVTAIGEGFSVLLKLSLAAGIAVATPIWVHQLWSFTWPALTGRERKYAVPATFVGIALFCAGLVIGFVTLRYPINWLLSFDDGHFIQVITADNYFTFVAYFLLAFGLTFELPVVLTFLAIIGVVSSKGLKAHRAHTLVGLWIASCFVTPGADPYSPLIVGVALTVLYFISETLIRLIGK